jgi:hypothetical protein
VLAQVRKRLATHPAAFPGACADLLGNRRRHPDPARHRRRSRLTGSLHLSKNTKSKASHPHAARLLEADTNPDAPMKKQTMTRD